MADIAWWQTVERNARYCKKSMSRIRRFAQIVESQHFNGKFPTLVPSYPGLRVVRNYISACPSLSYRQTEQQSLILMDQLVDTVLVFHNA